MPAIGELEHAPVLYRKHLSTTSASIAVFAVVAAGVPAHAEFSAAALAGPVAPEQIKSTQVETAGARTSRPPWTGASHVRDVAGSGEEPIKIAHCSGCTLGPAQLLEETKAQTGRIASDSLWGNLILGMAFQRDKELQKLIKKQSLADIFTLATVAGLSGLGIAQNAASLSTLNMTMHMPMIMSMPSSGGGMSGMSGMSDMSDMSGMSGMSGSTSSPRVIDQVSSSKMSAVPGILGMVGSGSTLLSLVGRMAIGRHYKRLIIKREILVKQHVEEILAHLESHSKCMDVEQQLTDLIGERATREFMQIWNMTHAVASAPKTQG